MLKYRAGSYARLSKEDGEKAISNSIKNQQILIRNFISEINDMVLLQEYADDGYSGGSFERPGIQKMLSDIDQGKINCVVVKDLSRLGRNYIEVGKYLEVIFPLKRIRFVAISDSYDSDDTQNDDIILSFQNLINDIYLRDISIKIKSQLDIKRKRGEFVGNYVPYGYARNESCKTQLVVDDEAAVIVQKIFNMFLKGKSTAQIAKSLNEENILSPFEYKKLKGAEISPHLCKQEKSLWHGATISKILRNEVYVGTLVQGKSRHPNFRVKKAIPTPRHEWTRVENTHEKIISTRDFEVANSLLDRNYKSVDISGLNLFSGFLVCGDCGKSVIRHSYIVNNTVYNYYVCSGHKKHNGCSHHRIRCDKVYQWVFDDMKTHHKNMKNLTREMVIRNINMIKIYKDKQIEIVYTELSNCIGGES